MKRGYQSSWREVKSSLDSQRCHSRIILPNTSNLVIGWLLSWSKQLEGGHSDRLTREEGENTEKYAFITHVHLREVLLQITNVT